MSKGWHKEDIKAAVRKTGMTLEELSRRNGLQSKACAQALHRPFIVAELVIAEYLGVSPRQLWPQRFEADGRRLDGRRHRKSTRRKRGCERQNEGSPRTATPNQVRT